MQFSRIKFVTNLLIINVLAITILFFGDVFKYWSLSGPIYHLIQGRLLLNGTSLVYFALTSFIAIVLFRFSVTYLYHDRWYAKFYLNLTVFIVSLMVASLANQFIVFIVAWEFVGLTSVFLIAFYQDREGPVKNAFRTLVTYKIGDVCLYIAVFALARMGVTTFGQLQHTRVPEWIFIFFLLAAMVKAAQYPFSFWLPRAMEGPTPTSAVFYGSLAVHLGVLLFMRIFPTPYTAINGIAIMIGVVTLLHASFVGRTIPDTKKSYAYATMSQLAIMFIEVGFGFKTLALIHLCSHVILRFYQFLQVPSILHRRHELESNTQRSLQPGDRLLESIFPQKLRRLLYYFSFDEGKLHYLRKRLVVRPVRELALLFNNIYSPLFKFLDYPLASSSIYALSLTSMVLLPFVHTQAQFTYAPILIYVALLMGLSLAISLFAETDITRFFIKAIGITIIVYGPLFFSMKTSLARVMVECQIVTLVVFYKLLTTFFENPSARFAVRNFLGNFEAFPRRGRWSIVLLLLATGAPLSPFFFLIERAIGVYLRINFEFGILFILTDMFMYLSIYRLVFLVLFGPNCRKKNRFTTAIYVPEQWSSNRN